MRNWDERTEQQSAADVLRRSIEYNRRARDQISEEIVRTEQHLAQLRETERIVEAEIADHSAALEILVGRLPSRSASR